MDLYLLAFLDDPVHGRVRKLLRSQVDFLGRSYPAKHEKGKKKERNKKEEINKERGKKENSEKKRCVDASAATRTRASCWFQLTLNSMEGKNPNPWTTKAFLVEYTKRKIILYAPQSEYIFLLPWLDKTTMKSHAKIVSHFPREKIDCILLRLRVCLVFLGEYCLGGWSRYFVTIEFPLGVWDLELIAAMKYERWKTQWPSRPCRLLCGSLGFPYNPW